MSNLFNTKGGGAAFPIVFSDGSTYNIPMSKVHISKDGVKSIPDNCFPILVRLEFALNSSGGWGWGNYTYGATKSHQLCSSSHQENDRYGEGGSGSAYVPFCCVDYNDLITGKFVRNSNRPGGILKLLHFIWAEK